MKKQGIVKAKVVGYPVTPYIIIFFSVVLIVNNIVANITQSALCILLILSGLPFYVYFLRKNKAIAK
jgi:APA family basic amino acid/polyamine antiporter